MAAVSLAQAPLKTPLMLLDAGGGSLDRRLVGFGLRPGSRLELAQRTAGGGRVALVGGSRVALGAEVLAEVTVEVAE
jgi:Fe2+ transport system protein FeoA